MGNTILKSAYHYFSIIQRQTWLQISIRRQFLSLGSSHDGNMELVIQYTVQDQWLAKNVQNAREQAMTPSYQIINGFNYRSDGNSYHKDHHKMELESMNIN